LSEAGFVSEENLAFFSLVFMYTSWLFLPTNLHTNYVHMYVDVTTPLEPSMFFHIFFSIFIQRQNMVGKYVVFMICLLSYESFFLLSYFLSGQGQNVGNNVFRQEVVGVSAVEFMCHFRPKF
jgi:hypothetical protein